MRNDEKDEYEMLEAPESEDSGRLRIRYLTKLYLCFLGLFSIFPGCLVFLPFYTSVFGSYAMAIAILHLLSVGTLGIVLRCPRCYWPLSFSETGWTRTIPGFHCSRCGL